jgi:riboflavin kinase/FMN adenylyltransferase
MRLYRTLSSLRNGAAGSPRAVTIGVFDGLHVGHQEILGQLKAKAAETGSRSLVFSFEPMPMEYFSSANPPPRLTRFRERFERLDAMGIDEFFCPRFGSIRHLSPEAFIREILVAGLRTRHIVVGHDFRFAANRLGTLDDLYRAGAHYGFGVTTVPPVYCGNERVSSTAIRQALRRGDLREAKRMLGREYSISGRVVRGLGLGKKLGFPTANVNLKRRRAPVDGIFAARVGGLGDSLLDGVASVGTRPTVGGGKPLLEVFIFDFDREIYGDYITVHFVQRLREERAYTDLQSLRDQIDKDVIEARAALAA